MPFHLCTSIFNELKLEEELGRKLGNIQKEAFDR
jgi:hypothetical protein